MTVDILIFFLITYVWVVSSNEAFNQLSRGRVRRLENENRALIKTIDKWMEHRHSYLIVFKILIYFYIAIIAALIFDIINKLSLVTQLSDIAMWYFLIRIIVASIITIILVLIAETITKLLVFKNDILILKISMPIIIFLNYSILYPFVSFINMIKYKLTKSKQNSEDEITTTEDEIMSLLENNDYQGFEDNSIEEDEKQMIKGIFDLGDTTVKELMTPRVDVVSLPSSSSVDDAIHLFIESGHSRIPIYQNTVDEITGIILAKDFLDTKSTENKKLEDYSHNPIYIPETKKTGELLNELRGSHNHFSVIIDEYGGTAGIVTLEDILEEIVGEIHDEHETSVEPSPYFTEEGFLIIDARTIIDEVNEILKINIQENEDVDTIGGLLCSQLGKIPEVGEDATIDGYLHIKVLKADERRVLTLQLKLLDKD